MKNRIIPLSLAAVLCVTSLMGCSYGRYCSSETTPAESSGKTSFTSLTAGIEKSTAEKPEYATDSDLINDFSLRLFENVYKSGQNVMISPLSILYSLGTVSLGARENSLKEIEDAVGCDRDSLTSALVGVSENLQNQSEAVLVNSIWFDSSPSLHVKEDFLKSCCESYDAEVFEAEISKDTVDEINAYISEKTLGMVNNVLDELSESAVMFIINTLAFDCEWMENYTEDRIHVGKFTNYDGSVTECEMMYSGEYAYISGDGYSGFTKYYKNNNFAFAAFLPDEGKDIADVLSSLSGNELTKTLARPDFNSKVDTKMPKFSFDYRDMMNSSLEDMGISDVFSAKDADLCDMAVSDDGNVFIKRYIHQTHIEVAEQGTKAGAATDVEFATTAIPGEPVEVTLDRPFLFMIYSCNDNIPLFIGAYEKAE